MLDLPFSVDQAPVGFNWFLEDLDSRNVLARAASSACYAIQPLGKTPSRWIARQCSEATALARTLHKKSHHIMDAVVKE